ncbi:MAG: hypothetical protein EHM87_20990 [Burkholderiales bacterium]|nr:MAG: hypothetical protein EHM87_20990 [Burkholderiales bacterium]
MSTRRSALLRLARAGAIVAVPAWPQAGRGAGREPTVEPMPATGRPTSRAFAFALIGDLPYTDGDEASLAAMLAQTDADALRLVLHVGDIKASREPCSDALYERRAALLARSAHPLVLLPGDNEWTDCHRDAAGGFDPIERLGALRARFWSDPGPLGTGGPAARGALAFERQAGLPENVRWRIGGVRFVAAHVVGSHNGRKGYPGARAEFDARTARNRQWLAETLRLALRERADALVIAFHAEPDWQPRASSGFADWIAVLRETAEAFRRPILLLHGDAHRFTVDRPLRDAHGETYGHVLRVQSFGWPFSASWVRIAYDPELPGRFHVSTREVAGPRP